MTQTFDIYHRSRGNMTIRIAKGISGLLGPRPALAQAINEGKVTEPGTYVVLGAATPYVFEVRPERTPPLEIA